jgi:membrane protease YdiL (CAAX protease family)
MDLKQLRAAARGLGLVLLALVVTGTIGLFFRPSTIVVELGVSTAGIHTHERSGAAARADAVLAKLATTHSLPSLTTIEPGSAPGAAVCEGEHVRLAHRVQASRPAFSRYFADVSPALATAGLSVCARSYRLESSATDAIAAGLGWGSVLVALGVLAVMTRWRRRDGRLPWSPRVTATAAIGLGLAAAALAVGLEYALLQLADAFELPLPDSPDVAALRTPSAWLGVLAVVVAAPFVEEFAFRAWFLEQASKAVGALPALALSVVPFTFVHGPQTLMHGAIFVVAGLVLGLLWLRTRSLLCCVVAHAGHNAAVLAWD